MDKINNFNDYIKEYKKIIFNDIFLFLDAKINYIEKIKEK